MTAVLKTEEAGLEALSFSRQVLLPWREAGLSLAYEILPPLPTPPSSVTPLPPPLQSHFQVSA